MLKGSFVIGWVSARLGDKMLESLRCRVEKEVRRYLQPSGYIHEHDGLTDGRTFDTG